MIVTVGKIAACHFVRIPSPWERPANTKKVEDSDLELKPLMKRKRVRRVKSVNGTSNIPWRLYFTWNWQIDKRREDSKATFFVNKCFANK